MYALALSRYAPDVPEVRPRPGGRSARVRSAVHMAARELLVGPEWAQITLGAVAGRAGVQPSSLYRRWGTLHALLTDVLEARLDDESPLPDTGSLGGDLHAWAAAVVADLLDPEGPLFLRAVLLLEWADDGRAEEALPGRTGQIEELLERGRARGDRVPALRDVFELLISPIYGYALFGPARLRTRTPALVDRLLDTASSPRPDGS